MFDITSSDSLLTMGFLHSAVAEENIGVDLEENVSGSRVSLELDFGGFGDGDLGVRMPEPGYHPMGRR